MLWQRWHRLVMGASWLAIILNVVLWCGSSQVRNSGMGIDQALFDQIVERRKPDDLFSKNEFSQVLTTALAERTLRL